jgi:hypothetical protein
MSYMGVCYGRYTWYVFDVVGLEDGVITTTGAPGATFFLVYKNHVESTQVARMFFLIFFGFGHTVVVHASSRLLS